VILCGVHTPELEIAWLRKRDRKYRLAVVGCGQIGKFGSPIIYFKKIKKVLDFDHHLWSNVYVVGGSQPKELSLKHVFLIAFAAVAILYGAGRQENYEIFIDDVPHAVKK